jgi:hypothetical protein
LNELEIENQDNMPENLLEKFMSLEKFQEEILKLGDMIMESKKKQSTVQESV